MQAGVSPTPSSTQLVSEKPLGQNHASSQEDAAEETEPTKTSQPDEAKPATTGFRYIHANVLSRSFKGRDSAAAKFAEKYRRVNSDSNNADSSKVAEAEGGVAGSTSDRLQQSSLSEESFVCTSDSADGRKTELNPDGGRNEGTGCSKDLTKSPVVRTHPYSRRIDIPPPVTSDPAQRHRPRILTYERSDAESPNRPSRHALLARRSTVASISPGKRLLPATPMRRGSRVGKPVSPSVPTVANNFNSFATKLASSLEGVAKENSLREDHVSEDATDDVPPLEAQHNPSPSGSSSSINSREEQTPGSNKIKHTVQYKESKKGRHLYLVPL